jgi:3-isopropylmalate/(R)-2-methylmalate dehydratase large subunit
VKIPKKKELLELQKKYRTDKKIGEVYGVPARLVAYWRSKKNIGAYNLPKYSREKIIDLWERYGDDRLAGRELGISGAGFRRWRKEYAINKKPAQLKMEQLELGFIDIVRPSKTSRRETVARKILARAANLKTVEVGQDIEIIPDMTIVVDNACQAIEQFKNGGGHKVWDSSKITIVLDSLSTSDTDHHADNQKLIREFVKKQGISDFYDIGWGISHQVVFEEGLVLPGQFVLSTDHYGASSGCIAAMSSKISFEQMGRLWSKGRINYQVPKTLRVTVNGHLSRGVSASDIIFKLSRDLAGYIEKDLVIEFNGQAVSSLPISQRFNFVNLAVEIGATSAIMPYDDVTQRYARRITKAKFKPVKPDYDAEYDNELEADISYLTPQVICPDKFKRVNPVEEMAGKRIDQVVLGGFTHSCLDDLEIAAKILRGRRIYRNTRMMVIPGSRKTYLEALDRGYIRTFIESGCLMLNPNYSTCISASRGMLAKGERALTTSKLSSDKSVSSDSPEIYVASPATAAATALNGAITDPRKYLL